MRDVRAFLHARTIGETYLEAMGKAILCLTNKLEVERSKEKGIWETMKSEQ